MRPADTKRSLLSRIGPKAGYIFLGCVFLIFMQAGLFAGHSKHTNDEFSDSFPPDQDRESPWSTPSLSFNAKKKTKRVLTEHPIPKLMENAEATFRAKVAGQSQTLAAAVKEYQRRYKRDPPRGFDEWWKFAQENEFKMVDEFDGLVGDLEPFWSMSGEELRRRAFQVASLPSIDLVRVTAGVATMVNMNNGFVDSEVSARAAGFRTMIRQFVHTLPDLDFPINAKAEGRVVVPWEHRAFPNTTYQDSSAGIEALLGGPFVSDWGNNGNVWEAWRRTCPPNSPARRLYSSQRPIYNYAGIDYTSTTPKEGPGEDFNFAATTSAHIDFCTWPHAHLNQGHFFSDWRTLPALYPIFSPARAKGFLDIRIPSHYYHGSTKQYTYGWDPINLELKDVDPMEVPWEDKISKIFWRGASTGGGSHPPGFSHQYQRHRFLRMTSDSSAVTRTVTFADPPAASRYVSAKVPIAQLNDEIMDTAFVKAMDPKNYPGGLEAMMRDHRFGDAVPLGRHWSYKYLIDFDGMSYSGRFLAFLASDSAAIKSTVYEEFFTDWIQPWLHFIPISSTYKEIYNIHAFFSGPTQAALEAANSTTVLLPADKRIVADGDRRLRRIARAGKQWKRTMGRKIDMEVYVYRLCLEYARLSADDREAMGYTVPSS